jgi:hypothetical protein
MHTRCGHWEAAYYAYASMIHGLDLPCVFICF